MKLNNDFMMTRVNGSIYLTNGHKMFTTNLVGAQTLHAIGEGKTADEVAPHLASKYGVERSIVSSDVAEVVDDFKRMGILID